MELVCSGWLTKSPPESKLQGPFKFLHAKWKKRYFILHKPSGSLPGHYALDYYKDHTAKKLYGTIDLDQTEEIIAELFSPHYRHLFSIKSKDRGKDRTYYLAADSETDMNRWVEYLCSVCGLKDGDLEEEEPTPAAVPPAPPVRTDSITVTEQPVDPVVDENIINSSLERSGSRTKPNEYVPGPGSQNEEARGYIPLEECYSGGRPAGVHTNTRLSPNIDTAKKRRSVDSIPDEPPPPPPKEATPSPRSSMGSELAGQTYDTPPQRRILDAVPTPGRGIPGQKGYDIPPQKYVNLDTVVEPGVYDSPPNKYMEETRYDSPPNKYMEETRDSVYKVPPRRTPVHSPEGSRSSEWYSVPPRREGSVRDSNSSNASRSSGGPADSGFTSEEYDLVPRKYPLEETAQLLQEMNIRGTKTDVYDVPPPPTHKQSRYGEEYDIPPRRESLEISELELNSPVPAPPRPPKPGSPQTPYMNLPNNSKIVRDKNANVADNITVADKTRTASYSGEITDDIYAFPKNLNPDLETQTIDPALLLFSPPPPSSCGKVPHKYINAATGFVDENQPENYYFDMQGGKRDDINSSIGTFDDVYTFMKDRPNKSELMTEILPSNQPQPSEDYINYPNDQERTVFFNANQIVKPPSMHRQSSDIYVSPPSNQPVNGAAIIQRGPPVDRSRKPRESIDKDSLGSTLVKDTYQIVPNHRTRSFKRKEPGPHSSPRIVKHPAPTSRIPERIALPQRTNSASSESESDSDDDRPNRPRSSTTPVGMTKVKGVGKRGSKTPPPKRGSKTPPPTTGNRLTSTPPPPRTHTKKIEYLDLDFPEGSDAEKSPLANRSPMRTPQLDHFHTAQLTHTDYQEIDEVRTKALSEVKRARDYKRKSSDKD